MTLNNHLTEKQLEILHDHYKETFARLRVTETLRDRLFLWVLALYAVLAIEIAYPAEVGNALETFSLAGIQLKLDGLPLPALLSVSWMIALTIGLRYCQASVFVNRQYPYLHLLEDAISPAVGGGDLYRREGKVYLSQYPLLLDVAWLAYGLLFPGVVIVGTVGLAYWEITQVPYPVYYVVFDTIVGGAIVAVFFIYRIYPSIVSRFQKRKLKGSIQVTSTVDPVPLTQPVQQKKASAAEATGEPNHP